MRHLLFLSFIATCIICINTSCNKKNDFFELQETVSQDMEKSRSYECDQFTNSLHNVFNKLSKDKELLYALNDYAKLSYTRSEVPLNENVEIKLEEIIQPLIEASDDLLNTFNVKDLEVFSSGEKVVLSMLLYADYMDGKSLRGGIITDNHYVDCALTALGITSLTDIASEGITSYVEKHGTRALLKTVAKFAGRAISWGGYALAAYDFYTCL